MTQQDDSARDHVRPHEERWAAESPFVGEAAEEQAPIDPWYQGYTPFVEGLEEMYAPEAEWEAHLAVMEAESPFQSVFEQGQTIAIEPEELEEEFVEEDESVWEQDEFPEDEAEAYDEEETYAEGEEGFSHFEAEADIIPQNTVASSPLGQDQRAWVLALEHSAIERLPDSKQRHRFLKQVDWSRVEFPGNGPQTPEVEANWKLADALFSALAGVTPERRVPFNSRVAHTIRFHDVGGVVVPVPGQEKHKLFPEARDAFVRMHDAAAADGVRLTILSAWRDRKRQEKARQNQPNPKAVAKGISPHMYGLAVDLRMSVAGLQVKEANTRTSEKMANVVRMYRSPVYKWMALRGSEFGWYPYRREPWHWEYNPPGFKDRFEGAASASTSVVPGATVSAPPSQKGATKQLSELVRFAQRVLNVAEGERLSDDGDLGRLTRAALERFRKKYSLGTGGVLDAPTELALAQRALEELAQASMFAQPGKRDARTEQALITFKSTRQLGMDATLDAATRQALTDALARMAPKPASTSTYLGGKLWSFESKTLPMRVAVFCPQAALSKQEVEVLVYAHGLVNGCPRPKIIPSGMITDAPFKLGGIVAASGRPIVLVVPYLDWANPGGESAFGKARRKWHALGKPAHMNGLVAEALAELGRAQSNATPSLRNLVIAGHSRAYDLLEPLAHSHSDPQMQQGALARLSQVWAFDTTYTGDVSKWMSWLDAKPGLKVSVFYEPGSRTGDVGKKFYDKRSARLAVIHAKEGHCAVPAKRLPALLKPPVSATDQETEAPWGEDELDLDEANLGAEDYAPVEAYNDATGAEFYREFDEAFESAGEHHEVDLFDPLYELDVDEQHLSAEPELDALAFEALGSDDEYVFDEEFEFEEEDYADQTLEEEAYGFEQETFLEPEAPPASEVVFPSGQSLRVVAGYPEGKDEEFWDPTGSGNPLLDTGPAHKEKKLSTTFTVRELTTSGGVSADIARIDPKLVESLQRLRDHLGKSVTTTSGYRSWKRNKDIYAQRNKEPTLSQHCGGRGVDIKIKGMNGLEIGKAAIDACGPNIGVGLGNTFAHIDVRGHAEAWNYGGVQAGWVEEIKKYQQAKGGNRKPSPKAAPARPASTSTKPPAELVRFAQRVLNAAEGERLDDDGDLGRLTRGALERFRRKYELSAGGLLDGKTQLALAQRALEEIAQQSIFPQPGVLDAKTEQALRTFKSERRLGFDATLDAATRAALADALARRVSAPSAPLPAATPSGLPKLGAGRTPPTDPTAYRKFRLTTYYVVDQRELPTGAVRVPVYDDNGRKIAEGSPAFFAQLSLEGTARLTDKRLINVTGKTVPVSHDEYAEVLAYHRQAYAKSDKKRREEGKKPTSTAYSGIVVENNRVVRAFAFHEVPASRRGIGYGLLRGIPLVPFRTLAADIGHVKYQVEPKWKGKGGLVPPGTHVYIKEYDGLRLPDGTTHDGWFVVNDTGGAILGAHFDVFVGTRELHKQASKQVKLPEFGQVWFPGIEQRIPPGYTYGLKA